MLTRFKIQISILFQKLKQPLNNKKKQKFIIGETDKIDHQKINISADKQGTLIIKCDDIGDYLVWQHTWQCYMDNAVKPIYFVGNVVWKSLFEKFNTGASQTFWLDKKQWGDETYRNACYKFIEELNVETAITPLFTRNHQLDDLLLYASGAKVKIAWQNKNSFNHKLLINQEIKSSKANELEYFRNIEFVNQIYHLKNEFAIQSIVPKELKGNVLVIFPMANIRSKCWPLENFIKLINTVKHKFDEVILMGGSDSIAACEKIMQSCGETGLRNLSNQTSLIQTLEIINKSSVVICPDTAALHMAIITNTKAIVVSNGTNALRFTNYPNNVKAIYPPYFQLNIHKEKTAYSRNEIQTISLEKVIEAID